MLYKGRLLQVVKRLGLNIARAFLRVLSLKLRWPGLMHLLVYKVDGPEVGGEVGIGQGEGQKPLYIPYGVAIALGTVVALTGPTLM